MLYAILGRDAENSAALRAAARPQHLQHVKGLLDDGRLIFAGTHPAIDSPDPGPAGFTGSLIIAEFASLDDAHAWAASDPYSEEGVFAAVEVKPVLRVQP